MSAFDAQVRTNCQYTEADIWYKRISYDVCNWLHRLILTETDEQKTKDTIFHGVEEPEICISDYIRRIVKYCGLEETEFMIAMLYIRRLIRTCPHFPFSGRSIHRTILTAVLVATKMHRDTPYTNAFYAHVGGIEAAELARLERCILVLLEYRLFVSVDEYKSEVAYWHTTCQ